MLWTNICFKQSLILEILFSYLLIASNFPTYYLDLSTRQDLKSDSGIYTLKTKIIPV